jgi:hypothetical protein
MYLAKVFKTSEMPNGIANLVIAHGHFVKDGFASYLVGGFVKEVNKSKDTNAYDMESWGESVVIDMWFIKNGATDGETILIEHG